MTLITRHLSKFGHRFAYRESGAGEPLVLLHGVGLQSTAWAPQIAALSDAYRVIALDLPGHGGSDPLPVGSKLPDFVAWCYDVFQSLNLGPVNLAGHSMGALIAGGVAVSHPEMVRRVALLNGVFRRHADARAAVVARADNIHTGQVDLEAPLSRWFGDAASDLRARILVEGMLRAADVQNYATAYAAFAHGDAVYADQFTHITCPFLALTGDGDLNSTPAMSQTMSEQVQDGHCVVIKGQRHMVNLTDAAQVNAHLSEWLARPVFAEAAQ